MTHEKQKTAVDWLVETFKLTNVDLSHHKLLIEQAKELEKKQIMGAVEYGNSYFPQVPVDISEYYYNETFE